MLGTVASLAIIPSQNYRGSGVFLSHLLTLGVTVALLSIAFVDHRRPTGAQ